MAMILLLVAVPQAPVVAEDGSADEPGFVFVQIDGLSEPVLRAALDSGAMPFVSGLLQSGSHALGSWRTTAATTTTVMQAGVLHGRWRGIPGFRWWDRETGQLIDFLDRHRSRLFGERISGSADLLADGGASITNLYAGGAPRVVFTATHLDGLRLPWELVRYVADVPKDLHVLAGFADGLVDDLKRIAQGRAAPLSAAVKRKAPVPVVGPALEWALVDVTTAALVRELQRGTPLMYATFTTYDEVGHYAGPDHPAAIDALTDIDEALSFIASAAERAPRPYRLVVLSDHGQTDGTPFELRYGETLTDVMRRLLSDRDSGSREQLPPDLVVAESGNLAHVYLPASGGRLDASDINALHPGLIEDLAAHPGVGVVVVQQSDGGLLAIGPQGSHDLLSGRIERQDPISHYGPLAAESLVNIAAAPDAGDLVVISVYDPITDEVASFERQIGSHGGIGGAQMQPFVLYPSDLETDDAPLSLRGVGALRAKIDAWLEADSPPSAQGPTPLPPSAHVGTEVCVSAEVIGATGDVCARRDGFGASWDLQVTDTEADGQAVKATISLEVAEARDQSAALEHDDGVGATVSKNGSFSPRVGSALGDISIETCVVVRFRPDRCQTSSVPLPQLASQASPAQSARLEQLLFEESLETFMADWEQQDHRGVDADFDWSSDGCSAGPFAGFFDDRLQAACIRHDFAYRNLGNLLYGPTDSDRERVDAQLANDVATLGQADLAPGLQESLQRFGAPVFYGNDLATAWSVPDFLVRFTRTGEAGTALD